MKTILLIAILITCFLIAQEISVDDAPRGSIEYWENRKLDLKKTYAEQLLIINANLDQ